MKTIIRFALSPVALAVAGTFAQASWAADELAEFTKPDSEVSIGLGSTNREAPFFGQYSGYDQEGVQIAVNVDSVQRNDETGTWLELHGSTQGLGNRDLGLVIQRQGSWRFSTDWNTMTVVNPFRVNSANTGFGSTNVVIAPAIAPGTGTETRLETERDTVSVAYSRVVGDGLEASLRVRNQNKTGARLWATGNTGGTGGHNLIAEPIDSTTQELEGVVDYTTDALQLSGGYLGSWFRNANNKLTVTNGVTDEIALPPDNSAHTVFVSGGAALAPSTRGTFKVSFTKGIQDDPFMSVTNAAGKLTARTDLGGEVDTTLVQLGVSSRPIQDLTVRAGFRYEDRKDKTPVDAYRNDSTHDLNIPLSRTFTSAKVDGDYRLPLRLTASAGVEVEQRERSYPLSIPTVSARQVSFQPNTDETTVKLGLRRALADTANGSITVSTSKREGDGYLVADDSAAADVIDPIHWADRDRTKVRLALDWMPMEALSLQLIAENSSDKYDGRALGPRTGDSSFVSLDGTYAISDDWKLTAWVSHDAVDIDQASCSGISGGTASCGTATNWIQWAAKLGTTSRALGLGVVGQVAGNLRIGGDLSMSHDNNKHRISQIAQAGTGALPASLPTDYYYRTTKLNLFAEREHAKNASIRVDFLYYRTETDDWAWNGSGIGNQWVFLSGTGGVNDGSTIVQDPDEKVSFVGVTYRQRWQ